MSMTRRARENAKRERKQLYFDIMCSIVSSVLALTGIIFFAIMYGITDWSGFYTGLIFWIFYLTLSLFLLGIGLYSRYLELKYGLYTPRKKKKRDTTSYNTIIKKFYCITFLRFILYYYLKEI